MAKRVVKLTGLRMSPVRVANYQSSAVPGGRGDSVVLFFDRPSLYLCPYQQPNASTQQRFPSYAFFLDFFDNDSYDALAASVNGASPKPV